MTGDPPSEEGGDHESPIPLSSTVAARLRGALGWVDNVTEFDGVDAVPVPTALVAVTVKEYVSPFVRPVTVIGLPVPVAVYVSVLSVTV